MAAKKTTPSTSSGQAKAPKKAAPKAAKKAAPKASGDISIIETGGKQYMVSPGMKIRIEKMANSHKVGDKVTFDKVLLSQSGNDTTIGTPYISGAKVAAEIVKIGREDKVTVIKYKAKSNYFKKRGHRQPFVEVEVKSVA